VDRRERRRRTQRVSLRRKREAVRVGYWGDEEPPDWWYEKRHLSGHRHACYMCHSDKYNHKKRRRDVHVEDEQKEPLGDRGLFCFTQLKKYTKGLRPRILTTRL